MLSTLCLCFLIHRIWFIGLCGITAGIEWAISVFSLISLCGNIFKGKMVQSPPTSGTCGVGDGTDSH